METELESIMKTMAKVDREILSPDKSPVVHSDNSSLYDEEGDDYEYDDFDSYEPNPAPFISNPAAEKVAVSPLTREAPSSVKYKDSLRPVWCELEFWMYVIPMMLILFGVYLIAEQYIFDNPPLRGWIKQFFN